MTEIQKAELENFQSLFKSEIRRYVVGLTLAFLLLITYLIIQPVKGYFRALPIGSIIAHSGDQIHEFKEYEWLRCDGRLIENPCDYRELYRSMGIKWNSSTTLAPVQCRDGKELYKFNLPDLEDKFIKGASRDHPVGKYEDAEVGEFTIRANESDTANVSGEAKYVNYNAFVDQNKGEPVTFNRGKKSQPENYRVNFYIRVR